MRLLPSQYVRLNLLTVVLFTTATVKAQAADAPSVVHEYQARPELISARKIWDAAPHNAFTDLILFHDRWICSFREADMHVGPTTNGRIHVIASNDAETWESAAVLKDSRGDLRDAKLSILPDGRLLLLTAVHLRDTAPGRPAYQSVAFVTRDSKQWDGPIDVGEPDIWLWGLKWHEGVGLSVGYSTNATTRFSRLYKTTDGLKFTPIIAKLNVAAPYPNESAITFNPNGSATMLLRCDPDPAYIGQSTPPYTDWQFKPTHSRVGGPALTLSPDGRLLGAGRLHDGGVRTSLFWIDPINSEITEFLRLPSGGDCAYPGLVWHDGVLNISYYSSHEGKTSIYFAKVRVPDGQKP
ncbi:MAG TPA: sialidase family protein [Tepidisphaeraceae bacterium]|jgi:hypothetical protein